MRNVKKLWMLALVAILSLVIAACVETTPPPTATMTDAQAEEDEAEDEAEAEDEEAEEAEAEDEEAEEAEAEDEEAEEEEPTDTPEPKPTDTPEPEPTDTPEPEPTDTPEPEEAEEEEADAEEEEADAEEEEAEEEVAAAPGECDEMSGPTVTFEIGIKGEELAFDKKEITIEADTCQEVLVHFTNTSKTQEHNFILLDHNDMDMASDFNSVAMAAVDTEYYPEDDEDLTDTVLAHVENKQPGGEGEDTFAAPPPGEYLYICTVPGHFAAGDWGTLIVK
jgi:azurin